MQYNAFFQKLPNVILFLFKSGKHFLNPIHNMSSSEVKNVIALSKGTNKKRFVKTFHLVHIISCSSPRYFEIKAVHYLLFMFSLPKISSTI